MKRVTIKVYTPSGNFLKIWKNAKFERFTKTLNGGLGPCIIELGEKFDYTGSDLALNNEVRIIINDKDTGESGRIIYSGYISRYVPWINGHREGITVTLLGYYTKLAQDILKEGTTTTKDYANNATDVGEVFRWVMKRYRAETSNPKLLYDKTTIKNTQTTIEYKFEMLTYREAIDKLLELAPAHWFWYVDAQNNVHFRSKPSTTTHRFIFGRHFTKVRVERSMEKIKNAVLFFAHEWDGVNTLYKLYTDAGSVKDYGRRVLKVRDDRIETTTDADKMAQGFIAEHKDPDVKVIAEILDNNESASFGYDIESISPGDTCTFAGFNESLADIFKENMLITEVDYELDKAIITIEPYKAGIVNRTEYISRRIDSFEREGVPNAYST